MNTYIRTLTVVAAILTGFYIKMVFFECQKLTHSLSAIYIEDFEPKKKLSKIPLKTYSQFL
jgi:hypothetical protein